MGERDGYVGGVLLTFMRSYHLSIMSRHRCVCEFYLCMIIEAYMERTQMYVIYMILCFVGCL